jgi:hypothetical protein
MESENHCKNKLLTANSHEVDRLFRSAVERSTILGNLTRKESQMLELAVGKYYVNKSRQIARKVLRTDQAMVSFKTYHLDTGNSCDSAFECSKSQFISWADRETTRAELASLQSLEQEQLIYAPQQYALEKVEEPRLPQRNTTIQI